MTFLVKGGKSHHAVVFKRRAMSEIPSSSSPHKKPAQKGFIIEDISPSESDHESRERGFFVNRPSYPKGIMSAATAHASMIPDLFTSLPVLRDLLQTQSLQVQDETVFECLPFLSGKKSNISLNDSGVPHLDRKRHIQFLHKSLKNLPAPYVAADASRPWFFYWALNGLGTMGEDISEYRERIIAT